MTVHVQMKEYIVVCARTGVRVNSDKKRDNEQQFLVQIRYKVGVKKLQFRLVKVLHKVTHL